MRRPPLIAKVLNFYTSPILDEYFELLYHFHLLPFECELHTRDKDQDKGRVHGPRHLLVSL